MIRIATQAEAMALYNQPDIIRRVGKTAEAFVYQPYIAEEAGAKMLFVFWVLDDGSIEVHIAQPKQYLKQSRALCFKIIHWLFQHGATRIVTNAPPGKIANLARKVGMTEYKSEPGKIHFEVTIWESEQQS